MSEIDRMTTAEIDYTLELATKEVSQGAGATKKERIALGYNTTAIVRKLRAKDSEIAALRARAEEAEARERGLREAAQRTVDGAIADGLRFDSPHTEQTMNGIVQLRAALATPPPPASREGGTP